MPTFNPISEEEIAKSNLLPDGKYQFEVLEAKEKVSKAGNDILILSHKIWDENGREHLINDVLVFIKSMMWKVLHFSQSAKIMDKYKSGKIYAPDCVGQCGVLEISSEQIMDGRFKGKWKNVVNDYCDTGEAGVVVPKVDTVEADPFNDEIPF